MPKKKWSKLKWWTKIFIILYAVIGILYALSVFISLIGFTAPLSLYGVSTTSLFSGAGLVLSILFSLKALTAYSFITNHNSAPDIGIIDSIIGIFTCLFSGFIWPYFDQSPSLDLVFRLEILILLFFLIDMYRTKKYWKSQTPI